MDRTELDQLHTRYADIQYLRRELEKLHDESNPLAHNRTSNKDQQPVPTTPNVAVQSAAENLAIASSAVIVDNQ